MSNKSSHLARRMNSNITASSGNYDKMDAKILEMNVKGAIRCITDLLESDEDMNNLLLTEQSIARGRNEVLPLESHAR